ncbi:MAG: type II toxin-antitoxin system RelE/ParE family toxin [Acidobacteria bacterium]|nr:type II toxin-antitoxin system RelE/ParE family toxin [Acidobacteriota bacterium]
MAELLSYVDESDKNPFSTWFESLDAAAAARVTVALTRLEQGNISNVKGVGSGVLEYKIDFGSGYRIYFGYDGRELVILLGGGTKKQQSDDIATAKERWADYKRRKKKSAP